MTKDIWLISDTHFNHSNILNFTDSRTGKPVRPGFADVNHMNEHMIEKWNSRVKPGDIVYHLGDVVMGANYKEWMNTHFNRLNGSKRLIVGNHDLIGWLSSGGWFKKVSMWRKFPEFGLILTHVPLHISSMYNHGNDSYLYGIHGHIHQHNSPIGPYKNVCVEKIDYTPVHIETLAAEAKKYFDDQWNEDKKLLNIE
jgi:calcineurin-like phosphoesterase family protein